MSKPRKDSALGALSDDQRETLDGWLFEERVSYSDARERLEKEFGVKASVPGLGRYYQTTATERACKEMPGVKKIVEEFGREEISGDYVKTVKALVVKRLVQIAIEKPEKVRLLSTLARAFVAQESAEIRRGWLRLAEDRRVDDALDREIKRREHEDAEEHEEFMRDISAIINQRRAQLDANIEALRAEKLAARMKLRGEADNQDDHPVKPEETRNDT